jgi:hypothetical protein
MINDSQYPLLNNIQNDVYIVPEFHEETKMYTLEFFNEGEDEPFYTT